MNSLKKFFALESFSGILLLAATLLALIIANSQWGDDYHDLLRFNIALSFKDYPLKTDLLHFINDGLMVIFFFLVSLEIKRELVGGELSTPKQAILPLVGALGGVIVPAIIYLVITGFKPALVRGWAIPTATDIAFSIGILALFSSRVPLSLKVFLTALAIIDDLIAILIIAFFYTDTLSFEAVAVCIILCSILALLNKAKVRHYMPYIFVGFMLWVAVIFSGVHATVAGVILAISIPFYLQDKKGRHMLIYLESKLHPYVAFIIMPVFAFANAGINISGLTFDFIFNNVTLAIAIGLFLGKQLGISFASWLLIRLKYAVLPRDSNWLSFYATCMIAGIGFTMSLFVATLAFKGELRTETTSGILLGSSLSAIFGAGLLYLATQSKRINNLRP